jgi:hypothetical protein
VARTSLAVWILRFAAGPVALLAYPVGYLYHYRPMDIGIMRVENTLRLPRLWLILELAVVLACAVLYGSQKRACRVGLTSSRLSCTSCFGTG